MFNISSIILDTITHILTFKLNTLKIYYYILCPFIDIVDFWISMFHKVV